MLLYAYFTPKVDFKRKFNHHQSFLYEWRFTAQTIRKFRIGPSIRIESRIGRTIQNRIESRSFADLKPPFWRAVPAMLKNGCMFHLMQAVQSKIQEVGLQTDCKEWDDLYQSLREVLATAISSTAQMTNPVIWTGQNWVRTEVRAHFVPLSLSQIKSR